MGKVVVGGLLIIFIVIAVSFFPDMIDSSNEALRDEYTETTSIITAVGETSHDLHLRHNLYDGSTDWINGVTSNETSDAPAVTIDSYISSTGNVTVTGLQADDKRTLTITYSAEGTDDYVGTKQATKAFPALIVIGLIAVIGGVILAIYSRVT